MTPAAATAARPGEWRAALLVWALGTAALLLLFREEAAKALHIWATSAAYNHSWLVLPIALWLGWERRHHLGVLRPAPEPLFALLALPCAALWLVAQRMGIMEVQQFGALGVFYALTLAVFGWRVALAMAAPLSYLLFLVPFGHFTTPALQDLTAWMIDWLLDFTGIPHHVDSLLIEIPAGTFYVAEACAGLRFLIAALAFGALYAFVMFRSPWRRLVVMLLALVVPIIANGLRAFGLVMIGHWHGSAAAVAADHVTYGWLFFSLVIFLLILAGLPFRQDQSRPPQVAPTPPDEGRRPLPGFAAAGLLLACGLGAVGPATAALLDRAGGGEPERLALPLEAPAACEALADGRLRCPGGGILSASLLRFPAKSNWDALSSERTRLVGAVADEDVTFNARAGSGETWRARQAVGAVPAVAVAAWLDGRPAGDGLRSRAAQALHALRGTNPGGPVLVMIDLTPEADSDAGRARAALRMVVEVQSALGARAAEVSLGR